MWNNSAHHLWRSRRWKRFYARLGAKLSLLVFWTGICGGGLHVCGGRALHSRGQDNAAERNRQGKPRKTAISNGEDCLVSESINILSK